MFFADGKSYKKKRCSILIGDLCQKSNASYVSVTIRMNVEEKIHVTLVCIGYRSGACYFPWSKYSIRFCLSFKTDIQSQMYRFSLVAQLLKNTNINTLARDWGNTFIITEARYTVVLFPNISLIVPFTGWRMSFVPGTLLLCKEVRIIGFNSVGKTNCRDRSLLTCRLSSESAQ